MCLELKKLSEKYMNMKKNNEQLYIFDNLETLKYNSCHKDGLFVSLKLVKVENIYKIIFQVSKENKIILIYLIEESEQDLSNKYENIVIDIKQMNISSFINKYCDK